MAEIRRATSDIQSHFLSFQVLVEAEDFRYDFVGADIDAGNGASLSGLSIKKKLSINLSEYGHPGIQADILAICKRAVVEKRPVGLSSYFINFIGKRCQIWFLVAPYFDAESEDLALFGLGMIIPVEPIRSVNRNTNDLLSAPSLATLSTLARPPAPLDWAPL